MNRAKVGRMAPYFSSRGKKAKGYWSLSWSLFVCVVGCTTNSAPETSFICGGTVTAEDHAARTIAATTTEYSWGRAWVEGRYATSAVPAARRVFILCESRPRKAFIVEHRIGMTLGDVLNLAGNRDAKAKVLRQMSPTQRERFDAIDGHYQIEPLDLVTVESKRRVDE